MESQADENSASGVVKGEQNDGPEASAGVVHQVGVFMEDKIRATALAGIMESFFRLLRGLWRVSRRGRRPWWPALT